MADHEFEPTLMAALQFALGHEFRDMTLLERALTHSSYSHEHGGDVLDYERLEFLGDAVLELAISDWLYRTYPQMPEGQLTQMRARIVNARTLASLARNLELGAMLRVGVGEERTGGRTRRSLLADAVESVLGATYLDAGYDVAEHAIQRLFAGRMRTLEARPPKDPKSMLQEWAQAAHRITPTYEMVGVEGPDHDARFEAEVSVGSHLTARGKGGSKKDAQRAAAERALEAVGVLGERAVSGESSPEAR
ncbi:MAG: ribonuclease III [Myxococcota bacterium]